MTDGAASPAVKAWTGQRHPLWLYRFLQALLGPLVRGVFRTRRVGHRTIPKRGPVILVSNHVSNLDPVLVVCSIPRPIFHLGKHTLFTKPLRSWFFQTLGGQIPVDRARGGNQAAIDAAVRVLERGLAMGIYPEGGRSPDGRLRRGYTGVARLAVRTGAPVYPVAIDGTWHVWRKGQKFPRPFRRTRILVGPPRRFRRDPSLADDSAQMRRITDELMGDLAKLLGQSYDPTRAELLRYREEYAGSET